MKHWGLLATLLLILATPPGVFAQDEQPPGVLSLFIAPDEEHLPATEEGEEIGPIVVTAWLIGWTWIVGGEETGGTLSLYYDTDFEGFDGTLIEADLEAGPAANAPDATGEPEFYAWDASDLEPGMYYVYGVITAGGETIQAYAPSPIEILDADLIEAAVTATAESGGEQEDSALPEPVEPGGETLPEVELAPDEAPAEQPEGPAEGSAAPSPDEEEAPSVAASTGSVVSSPIFTAIAALGALVIGIVVGFFLGRGTARH